MEEKVTISIEKMDWSVPYKDIWNMNVIVPQAILGWLDDQIIKMMELDEPITGWQIYINGERRCDLYDFRHGNSDEVHKALFS